MPGQGFFRAWVHVWSISDCTHQITAVKHLLMIPGNTNREMLVFDWTFIIC